MINIDIKTEDQLNYSVYDAMGRLVRTGLVHQGQPIMLDQLSSGVYHLQLRDQKEWLGTKKVLLME